MKYQRAYLYENFSWLTWFWDVFPNFSAGISGTILVYMIFLEKKKYQQCKWLGLPIIGFYLTLEEYYPILSNNQFFDYNDIIFSWIDAFLGYIFCEYLYKSKKTD